MKRILCVVDLSESSLDVLKVASDMANASKAFLTILFPYRLIDRGHEGDVAALKLKLEQESGEKFASLKKQVISMTHLSYEFQQEIGFVPDRINSFVKLNKPDMIIISQAQANTVGEANWTAFQNMISNLRLPFVIVPDDNLLRNDLGM